MSGPVASPLKPENRSDSLTLADRMDPAIGEASSVMGAVMTELLRRSLRGGVLQLGNELSTYVGEQVDQTIADRTPVLEHIASEAADKTARIAATEVATEEVRAVEKRAQETDAELAARIEETARTTVQTAEALTQRLEEKHQETDCRIRQTAEILTRQLEEKHQEADGRIRQTADSLTGLIHETEYRVTSTTQESLAQKTNQLEGQLREAERRVSETAQVALTTQAGALVDQIRQVEERAREQSRADLAQEVRRLQERARERSDRMKARFTELEAAAAGLRDQHQAARQDVERLRADLQAALTRIAELEKPRGLRAFFRKLLFWKKAEANPPRE